MVAYLQYLTSRPRGFFIPRAVGGVVEGEDPARFVMVKFAVDANASVVSFESID